MVEPCGLGAKLANSDRQSLEIPDLLEIRLRLLGLLRRLVEEEWPGIVQSARLVEHGFSLRLPADTPFDGADVRRHSLAMKNCLPSEESHWAFRLALRQSKRKPPRIVGYAFGSRAKLHRFRERALRIKASDPYKLGRDLHLVSFPGGRSGCDSLWLPAGLMVRQALLERLRGLLENAGFRPIRGGQEPSRVAAMLTRCRSAESPVLAFETDSASNTYYWKGKWRRETTTRTVAWGLGTPEQAGACSQTIGSIVHTFAKQLDLTSFWRADREVPSGAFSDRRWAFLSRNASGRALQLADIRQHPVAGDERLGLLQAEFPPSHELLFFFLLEHFAGAWPTWLAPTQAVVLPVNSSCRPYAVTVVDALADAGFRVRLCARESLSRRIREEIVARTPHLLTVGVREEQRQTIAWRQRRSAEVVEVRLQDLVQQLRAECSLQGVD